jgi:hypothetical protein
MRRGCVTGLLSVAAAQYNYSLCLNTAYNLHIVRKTHKQTELNILFTSFQNSVLVVKWRFILPNKKTAIIMAGAKLTK